MRAIVAVLLATAFVSCRGGMEAPSIEIETDHLDMGTIPSYENTTKSVKIFNHGKGPLTIPAIQTGCGCTSGRMVEPYVPAGGVGTLEVTIDPRKVTAMTSTQTLVLRTNDPEKPTVQLLVSSQVQREFSVLPAPMVGGVIPQGAGATTRLQVVQNAEIPLVIRDLETTGEAGYFEATFIEKPEDQWAVETKREYVLVSRMLPTAPPGKREAQIILNLEDQRFPRIAIPIIVTVQPAYKIEPRSVTLGPIEKGSIANAIIQIVGKTPYEFVKVDARNAALTPVHQESADPNTHVFGVEVSNDATSQVLEDTWTFTLKVNEHEFLETVDLTVRISN